MSFCIIYLASPKAFHIYDDPTQASRLELIEGSLKITRSLFPTTDIFVFHEDYEDTEKARLPGATEFIQVDFSGKEDVVNRNLRRPYGYLMMCRFFSGVVQQHPRLKEYSHYIRLDDDSFFQAPILTEQYVKHQLLKHDYVFRSVFEDSQDQQSLFDFTLDFIRSEGYDEDVLDTLKKELRKKYFMKGDLYSGLAPYNNFHISSFRFWNNALIQRYLTAVEASNGILQKGWMDANIHGMMIYVLALFIGMKVYNDTSFGYRHNRHVSRTGSSAVDYVETLPFGV